MELGCPGEVAPFGALAALGSFCRDLAAPKSHLAVLHASAAFCPCLAHSPGKWGRAAHPCLGHRPRGCPAHILTALLQHLGVPAGHKVTTGVLGASG